MRKNLVILSSILTVAALLSGCSGGESVVLGSTTPSAAGAESDRAVDVHATPQSLSGGSRFATVG